ncbi:hypothetical protein R6Q59_000020 [Mikania micrantha]
MQWHRRQMQKFVWQSDEVHTVPRFELKAKTYEGYYLKKVSNLKRDLIALEVKWKAHTDKPFSAEYANDMRDLAFDQAGGGCGRKFGKRRPGTWLNYMHIVAGKTWYVVPRDATVAVENGYRRQINSMCM